ncbi:MAG TPA: Hsp20/alpha crystallin family protein [Chloroflexota bacterium]
MATNVIRSGQQNSMTRLPDLMDRLFRESFVMPTVFDQTLGGSARPSLPVNLLETPESYILYVALPGMKPDNADIQVVGREVTVKGHFEIATPEKSSWIWHGIPSGEFFETFTLPVDVQGEGTEATYENGILTLTLPKAEHLRPKSIKVSTAK